MYVYICVYFVCTWCVVRGEFVVGNRPIKITIHELSLLAQRRQCSYKPNNDDQIITFIFMSSKVLIW